MTDVMKSLNKCYILFLLSGLPLFGQVKVARDGDRITVDVQGKPFTALYIAGTDTTKPYFHPVRAASGLAVEKDDIPRHHRRP